MFGDRHKRRLERAIKVLRVAGERTPFIHGWTVEFDVELNTGERDRLIGKWGTLAEPAEPEPIGGYL